MRICDRLTKNDTVSFQHCRDPCANHIQNSTCNPQLWGDYMGKKQTGCHPSMGKKLPAPTRVLPCLAVLPYDKSLRAVQDRYDVVTGCLAVSFCCAGMTPPHLFSEEHLVMQSRIRDSSECAQATAR